MRITSQSRRLLATPIVTLMLSAASLVPALAQSQQPAQPQFGPRANKAAQAAPAAAAPATEIVATHGAWKIQCETPPAGAAGDATPQRVCVMVQVATSDKNPKAFVNLVVARTKQGDKVTTTMRMLVPVGVYLPLGVAFEVDAAAIGRAGYVRCNPQICVAQAELLPETLTKLKKGKEADFIIYEAPGLGLPVKMKLEGFGPGIADLDKL